MRSNKAIRLTTANVKTNKLDIASTQETNNDRTDPVRINGYVIYFGGNKIDNVDQNRCCANNHKDGVAIAIKECRIPNVINIIRKSGWKMAIRLKTDGGIISISILNTYSPNCNGYHSNIPEYWGNANSHIASIPNNYIEVWRDDNNRKLSRRDHNCRFTGHRENAKNAPGVMATCAVKLESGAIC